MQTFDALVIGGGPAGSTAAFLLAQAGWHVGLVEKTPFPRRKVCGEFVSATNFCLLERLGALGTFLDMAGPEVRQVGLFTGRHVVVAEMPCTRGGDRLWGRALAREHLDQLLLDRARTVGAVVWQPWSAIDMRRDRGDHICQLVCRRSRSVQEVRSRIVIAAHGSWWPGTLPTQFSPRKHQRSDLLAFKAHFTQSRLPSEIMPLLAFPGGYGGMVHCDGGRMSLSFCIRQDQLERWRHTCPGASAAETVVRRVQRYCRGLREALEGAEIRGEWLSAGPIRPGIRYCSAGSDGIFLVGNAAGEAHPAIAEGISLALQSAWVLCRQLVGRPDVLSSPEALKVAHDEYRVAWRRNFAWRIHASSVVACWAMRPLAVHLTQPFLRRWPSILAVGAHAGGKTRVLAGIGQGSRTGALES